MKLRPECVPCLMDRAVDQIRLATDDEKLRFEALSLFTKFLAEKISRDMVPARLGAERNRIIRRVTSNPDPYSKHKEISNNAAMKLAPHVEQLVQREDKKKRLKSALIVAVIGNSMEFGVAGHKFDPETFKQEFEELLSGRWGHDDLDEIVSRILNSEKILYLTDNSGEIVFDRILMREIAETGARLFVAAKSAPVQEDVTLDDAKALGIHKFAELLSAGTSVGARPDEGPEELREKLETADLILAKGMANYETLSEFEEELKGRLAYLLRAKCNPVASSLGVERGALVAKLVT